MDVQEIKVFIDSSKLFGCSDEYSLGRVTGNLCSFYHPSGVKLVVVSGDKVRTAQLSYYSAISPAVLWLWNEVDGLWELETYDFLEGSVRLRTISDFIHFYSLNKKGA